MMAWLRKKLMKILTYDDWSSSKLYSGEVVKSYAGRKQRFVTFLMAEHHLWFVLLALLTILWIIALGKGWPDFFSRLGAIIGVSALLFGMTVTRRIQADLDNAIYENLLKYCAEIADATARARGNERGRVAAGHLQVVSPNDLRRAVTSLTDQASKRKKPFYLMETAMGVLGTIQWAYGDWLICTIHSGNFSTC